jgi:membrane fusion protein (multidrug efflux system)
MKKMKIIVVLISALLIVACGKKQEAKGTLGPPNGAKPFQVITLPTQTVTVYATYPASIEGVINSEVRAKISGYIIDVLVDDGRRVKKGQTLFKLETQTLKQDAAAAKANVNAAQVGVDKLKPLVEKNIISNVQMETAKAQLQQAQSKYSSIVANIGYGNITSPVDGFVGEIRQRKGALVSATSQKPLTTVSQIDHVYAYFSLNESDYLDFMQNAEGKDVTEKIKNFPKVRLILANGSTYDQEGTIQTINSQVNAATGTISFRAIFNNPARLLTNGNSGKIQFPKTYRDVVVVPKESTYERQGTTYVYSVSKDSTAAPLKIQIEAEVDNLYIIKSGLKKGDQIVATGLDKLKTKTKIIPQETPFDSIAKPIATTFR